MSDTASPRDLPPPVADSNADPNADPGTIVCPSCHEVMPDADTYCEACGAALGAPQAGTTAPGGAAPRAGGMPCPQCGAGADEIDVDGYCTSCGARRPTGRDHLESRIVGVVAITDRGIRHHRNEDAFAIAAGADPGVLALVVCDGVSSSPASDVAAQAAADAACRRLATAAAGLGPAGRDALVRAAVADAQQAAAATLMPRTSPGWTASAGASAPSCTLVAALVLDGRATIGWVGDSRAYWLGADATATAVTVDHSWAMSQIALGRPEAEVMHEPGAHAITRWLGADAPPDVAVADLVTIALTPGERLLLCSDGLWNVATPGQLTGIVSGADPDADPDADTDHAIADALVAHALAAGGPDNITVVLTAPVPTTAPTATPTPTPTGDPAPGENGPHAP